MNQPTDESIATAAQCWCDKTTENIEMDTRLGMVFARRLDELKELHNMQLVAVMTATLQNTETSIKDRLDKNNIYWTTAYQDVCNSVDREMRERERAEKAERERDLLRKAVVKIVGCDSTEELEQMKAIMVKDYAQYGVDTEGVVECIDALLTVQPA